MEVYINTGQVFGVKTQRRWECDLVDHVKF